MRLAIQIILDICNVITSGVALYALWWFWKRSRKP